MRIGVLGIGRWGRNLIAAFDRQAEVVIACNTGGQASRTWLDETFPLIRASSDAREAIEDGSLDAIVVATPIATHAALAVDALRAGHHVFVEKPIATSAVEARRVVAAADRAGRAVFTGHTFLFDEGIAWLSREVDPGAITAIRTTWHKHGTFGEPLAWNLLPHDLAIAMTLAGRAPTTVSVAAARAGETELDGLLLDLDLGGVPCRIEIDRMRTERRRRVEVDTRDGTRYAWSDGAVDRIREGAAERVVEPTETPLDREVGAFLEACAGGSVPHGASGRFAVEVVEAVQAVNELLPRLPAATPT